MGGTMLVCGVTVPAVAAGGPTGPVSVDDCSDRALTTRRPRG